ncbi:MAG: hypothetical protein EKK55_20265 [Rhodocyclaceae bacterium]|nr:MAG: hypothetical protein EKK55_20265 [Rhodocyclaceae bacterium]
MKRKAALNTNTRTSTTQHSTHRPPPVLDVVQHQICVAVALDVTTGLSRPANVEQPAVVDDEIATLGGILQRVRMGELAGDEDLAQRAHRQRRAQRPGTVGVGLVQLLALAQHRGIASRAPYTAQDVRLLQIVKVGVCGAARAADRCRERVPPKLLPLSSTKTPTQVR